MAIANKGHLKPRFEATVSKKKKKERKRTAYVKEARTGKDVTDLFVLVHVPTHSR